ncbi:MAG: DnaJ domain-containing protein [Sphingomonadaceae bacterium]
MMRGDPFVDHYAILGVSPLCDARTLETAYHALAKKYHPDHDEAADIARFTEVIEAYKALKDPALRAEYDALYASETGFSFAESGEQTSDEQSALSDAEAHTKILMFLYKRRREQPLDAGVGRYFVKEMLDCSEELFDFHLWYLKEKGLIVTTEQGTIAITIEGVDQVIAMSRTTMRQKLLLEQFASEPAAEGHAL